MIHFMTRFGKLVTARTVVPMTAMTRKTMTKKTKTVKILVVDRIGEIKAYVLIDGHHGHQLLGSYLHRVCQDIAQIVPSFKPWVLPHTLDTEELVDCS